MTTTIRLAAAAAAASAPYAEHLIVEPQQQHS